jgi:hypothetical protein
VLSAAQAGQGLLAGRGVGSISRGTSWDRRPPNAVDPVMARRVVELLQTTYRGFNHQTSVPERDGGRVIYERVPSGEWRGPSGTWRAATQPRPDA